MKLLTLLIFSGALDDLVTTLGGTASLSVPLSLPAPSFRSAIIFVDVDNRLSPKLAAEFSWILEVILKKRIIELKEKKYKYKSRN